MEMKINNKVKLKNFKINKGLFLKNWRYLIQKRIYHKIKILKINKIIIYKKSIIKIMMNIKNPRNNYKPHNKPGSNPINNPNKNN